MSEIFSTSTRPRWIERQLVRRGIRDERVLDAMARVPREAFVPAAFRGRALVDAPIPIGCRQTVSQPFVVALSLQALALRGEERVLDVGTGSGYQAVLLSWLAREVYTIEVHQRLYTNARLAIERYAHSAVTTRCGDGSQGWPEAAPFDAIVVGACAPKVPPSLLAQLAPGGRLVLPLGSEHSQTLYRIVKRADGTLEKTLLERVLFVPLVGREGSGFLPQA
ncbi:MAG TPA: protein-L-isoaspartate(D-aspartate) O-methyltransferase [bacterium]|nr:protein-L-isoaspartate(D-aspartate) O-methyltransferase [bacterium]